MILKPQRRWISTAVFAPTRSASLWLPIAPLLPLAGDIEQEVELDDLLVFHDGGQWTSKGYLTAKRPLLGYSVGGGCILAKGVERKSFSNGSVGEICYIFFFPLCEFPQVFSHITSSLLKENPSHSHVIMSSSFCVFIHLNYPTAAHACFFSAWRWGFTENHFISVSLLNRWPHSLESQTHSFCFDRSFVSCWSTKAKLEQTLSVPECNHTIKSVKEEPGLQAPLSSGLLQKGPDSALLVVRWISQSGKWNLVSRGADV